MRLLFLILLLLPAGVQASVPSLRFMTVRLAKNHGSGAYKIKKKISFYINDSVVELMEEWTWVSSKDYLLEVSSLEGAEDKVSFQYRYKEGKKFFYQDGQLKQEELSQDFYWPLFVSNSSHHLRSLFYKNKVIPASALMNSPQVKELKEIKHDPEPFVVLSRVGGEISYRVSEAKEGNQIKSGVWIAQNSFNISKVKLISGVQISPKRYKRYSRNLWLPEKYSLVKDNYHLQADILSARSISPARVKRKISVTKPVYPKAASISQFYRQLR